MTDLVGLLFWVPLLFVVTLADILALLYTLAWCAIVALIMWSVARQKWTKIELSAAPILYGTVFSLIAQYIAKKQVRKD